LFADVIVAAPRTLTFEQTHQLTTQVERTAMVAVRASSPQGDIDLVVHVEPTISPTETVAEQIHYLADAQGVHAHDIHVREVSGQLEADFDLEIPADMKLAEAHAVASQLEQMAVEENPRLSRVTTHLEAPHEAVVRRQEVTKQYDPLVQDIGHIADAIIGPGRTHDVHLYRARASSQNLARAGGQAIPELDVVFHTTCDGQVPLSQVHIQAEAIKRKLRQDYPSLGTITIHTEPPEAVC
jgi:divalent metal cation (Fe/Co/Zn/Cd) transporter